MNQSDLKEFKEFMGEQLYTNADVGDQLYKLISTLPQVDVVDLTNAISWVEETLNSPMTTIFGEEHILWHAQRLHGLGGSEMGVVIQHRFEKESPYAERHDIIADKLMMKPPVEFSEDTLRGNLLESAVEKETLRKLRKKKGFKHVLEPDIKVDPSHPWLIGNPDFVYKHNSRKFVDDFKIPRTDKAEKQGKGKIEFGYHVQTHHYVLAMGDRDSGVEMGLVTMDFGLAEPLITGMIEDAIATDNLESIWDEVSKVAQVVMDDRADESKHSFYKTNLHRSIIPTSEFIFDSILEEGDILWDNILLGYDRALEAEGQRFSVNKKEELIIETAPMIEKARELTFLRKTSDLIAEKAAQLGKEMANDLDLYSDQPIRVGDILLSKTGKSKSVIDEGLMHELIEKHSIPIEAISDVSKDKFLAEIALHYNSDELRRLGVLVEKDANRILRFPTKASNVYKAMVPELEAGADKFLSENGFPSVFEDPNEDMGM